MPQHHRNTLVDRLIAELDTALRVVSAPAHPDRPAPQPGQSAPQLTEREQAKAAALMRVDHAGEVAAQALYRGQAAVSREPELRDALLKAADEEHDHLAWCEHRVHELGQRTSVLGPLWYAGGFAIGALAGLAGDRISLGFLAETERQVTAHLDSHLQRLPSGDLASRAIVTRMREEELAHAQDARRKGGVELPGPVRSLMRAASKVMTTMSYRI
ncbi:MAG TPA: 2-polyprenyl-3-methyl-6-methoxy-1,4-benzoquinone monooxygenase [Chromatiales bacterium]|nr:2-polyprenyl-3-methyl-6-methoxy-1,4-benzoquinone monooxygenase [Chromatiales bacterium]